MCIYEQQGDTLTATERAMYGSKRLGILAQKVEIGHNGTLLSYNTNTIGTRTYELTDHLGNVTTTILDRKELVCSDDTFYRPTVCSWTDYYPFGYPMNERSWRLDGYRYGFNGQESDGEVYGEKSMFGYEFRQYDSRLGRWWGIDQFVKEFPNISAYSYCYNSPIKHFDYDGRWVWDPNGNLVAEKGDQSYSLAKFIGTSQKNAITMLSRSNITADSKGILNLKEGQIIDKRTLYIETTSPHSVIVKTSTEAVMHYFFGNGETADLGNEAMLAIIGSPIFREKHNKITSQEVQPIGYFSIDLKNTIFHIGHTGVDYHLSENEHTKSVTYTLFTNTNKNSSILSDGFWDPNSIAEKGLGDIFDCFKADDKGKNLEVLKGKPYLYATRTLQFFFKPPEKNRIYYNHFIMNIKIISFLTLLGFKIILFTLLLLVLTFLYKIIIKKIPCIVCFLSDRLKKVIFMIFLGALCLISILFFITSNKQAAYCGLDSVFDTPSLPYNIKPVANEINNFLLLDEDGFYLIYSGKAVDYSQSTIDHILSYGYKDHSLIIKYVDTFDNIFYLISYETEDLSSKGNSTIEFRNLKTNDLQEFQKQYTWIGVDQHTLYSIERKKLFSEFGIFSGLYIMFAELIKFIFQQSSIFRKISDN